MVKEKGKLEPCKVQAADLLFFFNLSVTWFGPSNYSCSGVAVRVVFHLFIF